MAKKDMEQSKEQENQPVEKNSIEKGRLPVFLEIVFDLANLIMVFVPIIVAVVSFTSGANWINIVLRTAVAIIVTGILCSGITRKIVQESVNVTNQMLESASKTGITVDQKG